MKKKYILFLLVSLFFSTGAISQNFSITPSSSLTTAAPINEYVIGTITMQNTTSDSIVLGWDLITKTVPTGWDYSYCDYNTCYSASTHDGIMAKIAAGASAFIKVNAMTLNEGWAYFQFKVYDVTMPEQADTIEFWFNGLASTLNKPAEAKLSISPNPISQETLLTIDHIPSQAKVIIINSLGQQVYSGDTPQSGKLQIEANWTKGLYFIKIVNGSLVESRKLIVR
jgi:hypothetical protein